MSRRAASTRSSARSSSKASSASSATAGSPTIASVTSIGLVVGTYVIADELRGATEPRDGSPLLVLRIAVPAIVGAIALLAGTLISLRRVEP